MSIAVKTKASPWDEDGSLDLIKWQNPQLSDIGYSRVSILNVCRNVDER